MTTEPQYSALTDAERAWLMELTARAQSMGASSDSPESIGLLFDSALAAVEQGHQPPEIGNDVVTVVAAAMGEYLRAKCGLEWRIVTDELGSDLCLYDAVSSYTLFPMSSVAKRWESHEKEWVVAFCEWARVKVSGAPDQ